MAKEVGLSRKLKLTWLNQTISLVEENLSEDDIKKRLTDYLSFEITSPINVRKTREILMRIWVYPNKYTDILRPLALRLAANDSMYKVAVHWCMMLAAYPFFMDVCNLIGKMSEFQDEITLSQLRQKIFDEWGERTTLYHSLDKMIATLKELGALENVGAGKYRIVKNNIANKLLGLFMICAVMNIEGQSYYTLQEINRFSCLFPFEFSATKTDMLESGLFSSGSFGGEITFALQN